MKSRRFPSDHERRAVELGADELQNRVEWEFRNRPRDLRNARQRYRRFCALLLRAIEKNTYTTER